MTNPHIEESTELQLDFSRLRRIAEQSQDVVVCVAQDAHTGAVLIIGFASQEALDRTLETGVATFYSTSRQELWVKGATSGDYLDVQEIRVNCEQNSLLYIVTVRSGGSCHTKDENGQSRYGCFYRKMSKPFTSAASRKPSLVFTDPARIQNRAFSPEEADKTGGTNDTDDTDGNGAENGSIDKNEKGFFGESESKQQDNR